MHATLKYKNLFVSEKTLQKVGLIKRLMSIEDIANLVIDEAPKKRGFNNKK